MSSIGTPGSATYAETLSGIEGMLNVLPDNLANEITARNVRDVVYTLYGDLQGMSASEFVYTDSPATVTVGGINSGQVFASMSLQTLFNKLFHKDYPPTGSLAASPSPIDFGRSVIVTLTWNATKTTYDLNSPGPITRNPPLSNFNITIPPGGGSGTTTDTPAINVTNSYTFTFSDTNGTPVSVSATVVYSHRMYWGRRTTLTPLNDTDIRSLDGAGITTGNGGFASSFVRSFDGIDGSGQYLCWAFPSSFGTPKFTVNGLQNTAFTKINSSYSYTNIYGYLVNYDVWITDTAQNSPIAKLSISL